MFPDRFSYCFKKETKRNPGLKARVLPGMFSYCFRRKKETKRNHGLKARQTVSLIVLTTKQREESWSEGKGAPRQIFLLI